MVSRVAMANFAPEVTLRFCRFCLCDNESFLIPIESSLDVELSIEDIVRFTGIEINDDQKAIYSVCLECTNTLKISATFRNTCVQNDPNFYDMCAVLASTIQNDPVEFLDDEFGVDVGYVESDYEEEEGYVESDGESDLISYDGFEDDSSSIAPNDLAGSPIKSETITANCGPQASSPLSWHRAHVNSVVSSTIDKVELHNVPERCAAVLASSTTKNCGNDVVPEQRNQPSSMVSSTIEEVDSGDEFFSYSANYIPAGEILYEEDTSHRSYVNWHDSLNPTPYPTQPQLKRTSGRRLMHLCDVCGLLVAHLQTHYKVHTEEQMYSCPHCPVKTNQNKNLQKHIEAVHNKTISKTCEICGKGFIHHKTFRYHMEMHQGEGKTFQCPDCSKIFISAMYLKDHIDRVHSIVKASKKSAPKGKEVVPAKRSRLELNGK